MYDAAHMVYSGRSCAIRDFDLSRYDPHDEMMLFYDIRINRFVEGSFGYVVHDIHRLLAPWQIEIFKREKSDCIFPDITNSFLIELIYPDEWYTEWYIDKTE